MTNCSVNPYKRSYANRSINDDYFITSYSRAHYYENLINPPTDNVRKEHKALQSLRADNRIVQDTLKSVYNDTFEVRFQNQCSNSHDYGRSSAVSRPNLQNMHEKYMRQPVMPLNVYKTTTGTTYVRSDQVHTPIRLSNKSPIEDATCCIRALNAEEFPAFPINEIGYHKHLDPFVSTTQLAHVRFGPNQQNGVAKKDIITFYDATGTPKVRGFGPKKVPQVGPYFPRDAITSIRIQPKPPCRALRNTSSYEAQFGPVSTNLTHWDPQVCFYPIFKPSNFDTLAIPAMYRTEYSHVGTGWSSRAVVNIGRTRGCA